MMKYEINGTIKTLEIQGEIPIGSNCVENVINRWLHMEWLKENGIKSRQEARKSLAHIDFNELKQKYGFRRL